MAANNIEGCVPTFGEKINSLNVINSRPKSPDVELSYMGKPEGRVLVLYTGGTIGMMRNAKDVLAPVPNKFVTTVKQYPHMYDRAFATERFGSSGLLALPMTVTESRRVIYDIREYSPLLDSSNMTMNDWIKIAKDIKVTKKQKSTKKCIRKKKCKGIRDYFIRQKKIEIRSP
uniref:ASPG_1 protein n=1 Tax=Fopius arisanus TaxID=64838 RepID=A0A0C9QTB3_9HYME